MITAALQFSVVGLWGSRPGLLLAILVGASAAAAAAAACVPALKMSGAHDRERDALKHEADRLAGSDASDEAVKAKRQQADEAWGKRRRADDWVLWFGVAACLAAAAAIVLLAIWGRYIYRDGPRLRAERAACFEILGDFDDALAADPAKGTASGALSVLLGSSDAPDAAAALGDAGELGCPARAMRSALPAWDAAEESRAAVAGLAESSALDTLTGVLAAHLADQAEADLRSRLPEAARTGPPQRAATP